MANQLALRRRAVIEGRIGKGDVANGAVVQPAVVRLGGQGNIFVVEQRVGVDVELSLPAACERGGWRDEVGLPVMLREGDLDSGRSDRGELGQETVVVRTLRGGVSAGDEDRVDRGAP